MTAEKKSVKKASPADISKVIQLLESVYPVSLEFKAEVYSSMVAFELEKDEILVGEGELCHYMYFITQGALMAYSTHNGKTITSYISIENEFVSSISGLHGLNPSKEGIVAVEPTSLIAVHTDVLQSMFQKYFELNFSFRVMVEQYYRDAQERAHIIRLGNAKERYLYFIQTKPGYVERLPLEHVASFLDMKPSTLSGIIKQYKLRSTKDEKTVDWIQKINAYLDKEQAYKDKMISLGTFATAIGTSPHKLSWLLNDYYKLTFVDFINSHRIKCIKEQLSFPGSMKSYTIEAIAYDAGFSSRSAFYNSFKKLVGMSPVKYMQSLKELQAF